MSKKAFLKKLRKALAQLPDDEQKKTLDYYSELIDDRMENGATEEAAVDSMGDVDRIAAEMKADAAERGVSMKKRSGGALKTVLIILLVLVSVSALIFACGALAVYVFGVKDAVVEKVSSEWTEASKVFDAGEVPNVDIELEACSLFIGRSDDGKVHLDYYEREDIDLSIETDADGLHIHQKLRGWKIRFSLLADSKQFKLLLPESFDGNVKSELTVGETRIDNFSTPGKLDIRNTTGEMIIYDVKASECSLVSTTGRLVIGRCEFTGAFSVNGTTGRREISNVICASADIVNTTGSMTISDCELGDVEIESTTGAIKLVSVKANKLDANVTTGSMVLDHVDAKELKLEATTGSISGTLAGSFEDYSITSDSTTGSCNLPFRSVGRGDRTLDAETTTGRISISFGD